jgi:CheY-like chemotaxis protein/DNA-binding XRE family transcriptional regulator
VQIDSERKREVNLRFGTAVKHFRHLLGISQEGLAELAGLDRTYIGHVERGARNVSLSTIDRLAKALKISTATLLSRFGDAEGAGSERASDSAKGRSIDILIVEDRRRDVELTLRAFRRAEIANSVFVVNDGAAALDFLLGTGAYSNRSVKDRPLLVLLDLKLPKISGMEVLRKIKADPRIRPIHVIVLTSSQKDSYITEALRLGAAAYIVKPVDFQNFSQVTPKLKFQWALMQPPLDSGSGASTDLSLAKRSAAEPGSKPKPPSTPSGF